MFGFNSDDLTEITVLLDRSGSMHTVQRETVEGFAAFVEKQKKVKGPCRLTLHQFDTAYETVYCNRPIRRVPPLTLVPRGATALLDAMGKCIQDNGARMERLPAGAKAFRTIVVIITDGMENSSREYRREQVVALVKKYTLEHDWQLVYLGANQDAIQEAGKMGIESGAAMEYRANRAGTMNAWEACGAAVARHRSVMQCRMTDSYFTDEERQGAMKK